MIVSQEFYVQGSTSVIKGQATKKGATLNLKKYSSGTIEPLANLPNVAVSSRKYRNPKPETETLILALGSHGFQSIL